MDAAVKNSDEMIRKLTLEYNKARQYAINSELADIIGGAKALTQNKHME
jgi:F-type H+-transporting ATPase subunit gamma